MEPRQLDWIANFIWGIADDVLRQAVQGIADLKVAIYLQVFTIVGAIVGASITTVLPAVYLYFFFAAFLMTSFLRLRRRVPRRITGDRQDPVAAWLGLRGSYYDEALRAHVPYRVQHALLGGSGMFVAGLAAGMLGIAGRGRDFTCRTVPSSACHCGLSRRGCDRRACCGGGRGCATTFRSPRHRRWCPWQCSRPRRMSPLAEHDPRASSCRAPASRD